ncbi:MAG TPA: WD40 repeat domain-containing protein [Candidatus Angelobacter sp.]|nr:WD40 repeat domain-containing protein [Candidatus Angelobacter sp.]
MSSIHVASLAEVRVPENPFPGLRPFELNESHLFFGRDGQVEKLIGKLARSHLLAVVGASGSGKSSLVRAGLLPALLAGLMGGTSSNWRIAVLRPGHDPVANLAAALNASRLVGEESRQDAAIEVAMTEATLRRGSRGLIDAARQAGISANENLLVLVDQFEEIFRVARLAEEQAFENESAAFVKLLLEGVRQREVPIYVALTMRSDYLGDCARFFDLPEAINENQYLVPRLTRQELQQVITGPIAVGGGQIAPRLLTRLLNDMGNDQDQLPLLQHALMRMWEKWKAGRRDEPAGPIDIAHYQATGGMAQALSQHADEALNSLPANFHLTAERLFKALTGKGADYREIRRPALLAKLGAVTTATSAELVAVLEAFRQPGRSFLMPPVPVQLKDGSLIDIAHESLIRRWETLKKWVEEESESAKIYVRLAETAELHKRGKASLWQNPDLQYVLEWRDQHKPNAVWAARYHPGFAEAMDFLELSRQNQEKTSRIQEQLIQAEARAEIEKQLREEAELRALAGIKAAEQSWRSSALAAQAEQALSHDRPAALGLALQGWHIAQTSEAHLAISDSFPQLLATLQGHTGPVYSAVLSPDGQRILTASEDKTARVWNAATGQLLATLQGHAGSVWSAVFSPDGQRILTASEDKTAWMWNAYSGQPLVMLQGHTGSVKGAVFSQDGQRILTASEDTTARVWDVATGQLLATLQGHDSYVRNGVFSADGQRILTASGDRTAQVWNTDTGKPLAALQGHAGPVVSAVFSPDGQRILTASGDRTARVWNASTGQLLATLQGHSGTVWSAMFSPDGQLVVTASDDKTARAWNAGSGQLLATLEGHSGTVWSAIFSPDGQRIATASADKTARVWNVVGSGELLARLQGHSDRAMFSPNGERILTPGDHRTARVWSASGGELLATLQGHTRDVGNAAFSPDGQYIVTASDDRTARVWSARSEQLLVTMQGHTRSVVNAVFSPDGQRILTASDDKTARVWNTGSGQLLTNLQGHTDSVVSAVFSPDGQRILTASDDKTARVWSAGSGQLLATLQGHTEPVVSAVFSPDGRHILTASQDGTACVWSSGSAQLLAKLRGHTGAVVSAVFSPDGQRILTASWDKTARVWDAGSGQLLTNLQGHTGAVVSAVFSPDGQRILTASVDKTARVWNAGSGQLLAALQGHTDSVRSAVFSPDGQRILTASDDKTARVFRLVTISEIAELLAK